MIRALGRRLINLCRAGSVDDAVAFIDKEKKKRGVLDTPDALGRTALMYACTIHRMISVVALLLRRGADPAKWCAGGFTALHFAAAANNAGAVDALSRWPHLLNRRDCFGSTPLLIACARRKCKSAERLLIHGADVSIQDANGDTPLHAACRSDAAISVTRLILHAFPGALCATNKKTETPLQVALSRGATKTVELIANSR